MRISDWSSDVCSSDLADETGEILDRAFQHRQAEVDMAEQAVERIVELRVRRQFEHRRRARGPALRRSDRQRLLRREMVKEGPFRDPRRSEEHTSELQSLMRISYAVFCLKKKNNKYTQRKYNESSTNYAYQSN